MVADEITPGGFDVLLIASAIPLAVGVLLLLVTRVLRYRAVRGDDDHESAKYLASVFAAIAWVGVATAFLMRPIADLFPTQLTLAEQLVGPGARIVATIVTFVLLWHERAENELSEPGPPPPKFRRSTDHRTGHPGKPGEPGEPGKDGGGAGGAGGAGGKGGDAS